MKVNFSPIIIVFFLPYFSACAGQNQDPKPQPDQIPPAIVSLTPQASSSQVDLFKPIELVFSEAMNRQSINDSSISLSDEDGRSLEKTLRLSSDNKNLTLTIAFRNLSKNPGIVKVELSQSITDLAGNRLVADAWTYTTPTWLNLSDALDVDKSRFTFEPTLATDKDGNLVIAWYEQDSSSLKQIYVKRFRDGNWEQLGEALNTLPDSSADYPSLEIDYQNRPVLVWHETDTSFKSSIHLKRWNGTDWESLGESASGLVDEGEFPSLAITSDNIPVIAYVKNGDVFVRLWNGSSWVTWDGSGTVDDVASQNASRPSLVLLGEDPIPFVAFEETEISSQPSSNIYVKYYDAASFAWKDIDEINNELDIDVAQDAHHPNLSLALGSPIVSWEESNGSDRDIHVKGLSGATWQDIGNDDFSGQDSSETFLLQNYKFAQQTFTYPALVWRGSDGTGQNIYFKIYNDVTGLWETLSTPIEPINSPGFGSEHPVITIDKFYRPVVAFVEFDPLTQSQNLHVKILNFPAFLSTR